MSHNDPQPTGSEEQAPRFTREEERDLAIKAQQGDGDAREQLILSNIPWAKQCAIKFAEKRELDVDECISTANVALLESVDKFNPNRGRLTTLVAKCVEHSLLTDPALRGGAIRVPTSALGEESKNSAESRQKAYDACNTINIADVMENHVMADTSQRSPLDILSDKEQALTERRELSRLLVLRITIDGP